MTRAGKDINCMATTPGFARIRIKRRQRGTPTITRVSQRFPLAAQDGFATHRADRQPRYPDMRAGPEALRHRLAAGLPLCTTSQENLCCRFDPANDKNLSRQGKHCNGAGRYQRPRLASRRPGSCPGTGNPAIRGDTSPKRTGGFASPPCDGFALARRCASCACHGFDNIGRLRIARSGDHALKIR